MKDGLSLDLNCSVKAERKGSTSCLFAINDRRNAEGSSLLQAF